jgi:hypothetical protein
MGKPEIIGYQNDPNNWSAPRLPDMAIDSDGFWIERPGGVRRLVEDVDGFMRHHGYKRVYKPREFHAVPGGYGEYYVYCKTCPTHFATTLLPHDAAKLHTKVKHHHSAEWS